MTEAVFIETIKAHQAWAGLFGTAIVVASVMISGRRHELAMAKSGAHLQAIEKDRAMNIQDGLIKGLAEAPDLSVYRLARGRRSIAQYISRVFGARSRPDVPANDRTP